MSDGQSSDNENPKHLVDSDSHAPLEDENTPAHLQQVLGEELEATGLPDQNSVCRHIQISFFILIDLLIKIDLLQLQQCLQAGSVLLHFE